MKRLIAAVRALAGEDPWQEVQDLACRVGDLESALDDAERENASLRAELGVVRRDRRALRQAVRELRAEVEMRAHALWAAALCAARPGITLPAPGELDPEDAVEIVASGVGGRAPS